jgi:hypothetical protein
MTYEQAVGITLRLSALAHFPVEPAARAVIAGELVEMCETAEQALWLVDRALKLWTKWESARDLRAIYCARFKPRDGFEVNCSHVFPNGIVPSETPAMEWRPKALPPGRTATADAQLDGQLVRLAESKRLEPPPLPSRAERIAEQEFNRILEEAETGQPDRAEIRPPRHKRQSEIWPLAKDQEYPPGGGSEITAGDVERAVNELRARGPEAGGAQAAKDRAELKRQADEFRRLLGGSE